MKHHWAAGLVLGLALTACQQHSDPAVEAAASKAGESHLDQVPDAGFCDRLASSEWRVDPGCTGCTAASPEAATDGDDQTSATVTFDPLTPRTGGAAIRAHAPAGVIYPAGRIASAFLREPTEMSDYNIQLRTYLGEQLQETDNLTGVTGSRDGSEQLMSFATTKPFDAVEYYISVGASRTPAVAHVVELCLDGG